MVSGWWVGGWWVGGLIKTRINWEKLFDQKEVNAKVTFLKETILNVFNYITLDNKDIVWMNESIKTKTKTKNILYNKYRQNGKFERL